MHMDSHLLSIQYGPISLYVWPHRAIIVSENEWHWYHGLKVTKVKRDIWIWNRSIWVPISSPYNMGTYPCLATTRHLWLFPKTDDLEIWVLRSILVQYKTLLNWNDTILYPPYGISSRGSAHFLPFCSHFADAFGLWPCQGSCLRKWMTLNCRFQGQHRSNVMTDFNSQHTVSYLCPIQTMAPSVTVFKIFNIFVCRGNPIPTPVLWFWGKRPQIKTVDISKPPKDVP